MNIFRVITNLFSLLLSISANAQFKQEGVTLEYNRSQAKTTYTRPVYLAFSGASSTGNDDSGNFVLAFNNSKAGDLIGSFQIQVGDENYVLFNKDRLSEWVLTHNKKMEVLVCNYDTIKKIEERYTNNYLAIAKKRYQEQREIINNLNEEKHALENKLQDLEASYKAEIEDIKKQAVLFAYIDETELDSMELLMRTKILDNDIEGAVSIGQKMNLTSLAERRIRNLDIALGKVEETAHEALLLCQTLEQHIMNCLQTGAYEEEVLPYRKSLVDIYRKLVDVYQNTIRCSDDFLEDIKGKAGRLISEYCFYGNYDMSLIKEAAELGDPYALYNLATESTNDYNIAKKYAERLYNRLKNDTIVYPYYSSNNLNNTSMNLYESFPDFFQVIRGDTLFFHIINNNEVSLVYYRHVNKNLTKIRIPQKINFNGRKYSITRIGESVFCYMESNTPLKLKNNPFHVNYRDSDDKEGDQNRTEFIGITDIILPDGIKEIGGWAFCCQKKNDPEISGYDPRLPNYCVNIPKGIKSIGDYAYNGCVFKGNTIRIPEGTEHLGMQDSEENIIYIPSTLKSINDIKGNIIIHPQNPYFHHIYGNVYDSDTCQILTSSSIIDTLFISKNMYDIPNGDILGLLKINTVILEDSNPYYALYDSCLYTPDFSQLCIIPCKSDSIIRFHSNTTTVTDIALEQIVFMRYKTCIFPDSIDPVLPPSIIYAIASNRFYRGTPVTISYLGIQDTIDTRFALDETQEFIDKITDKHPNDYWLAINTAIRLIGCDLYGATVICENNLKDTPYYDSMKKEIEKGWDRFKKAYKYGIQRAEKTNKIDYLELNKCLTYLDFIIPYVEPKADFYFVYYQVLKHLRREKEAEEALNKVKEYDPNYDQKGHLPVYWNMFESIEQ